MKLMKSKTAPPIERRSLQPTGYKPGRRWTILLAVAMIISIVGSLLGYGYLTQNKLQVAAIHRLNEDLESRAKAVAYFIRERENDAWELATSSTVLAYFTNKSLGMTEEYGLRGSLNLIKRRFLNLSETASIKEAAIYERLVLFSTEGQPLVEYEGVSPCNIKQTDWETIQGATAKKSRVFVDKLNPAYLMLAIPVYQQERLVGYIAGWISLRLIHTHFLVLQEGEVDQNPGTLDYIALYLSQAGWYFATPVDNGLIQSLENRLFEANRNKSDSPGISTPGGKEREVPAIHVSLTTGESGVKNLFALRAKLPLEEIQLVRVLEQTNLIDPDGPVRLLILLTLVSTTVIGIAISAFRHDTQAQVLSAKLDESAIREAEFLKINKRLNDEILQRKLAENQVTTEKNLLRGLFNAIPDLVFFKNIESAYMGCNPAFEALCGITEADIISKTARDILDQETIALFGDQEKEIFDSGKTLQLEHWVTYPDGRRVLLDTQKTPYYSETGRLLGLIGISRDITARKQTESALEEQRKRLELVIHATNIGVWEWKIQTGETIFNERWAQITGYTLAELSPVSIQTWVDLCHPEDMERSGNLLQRHFKGEIEFYDCECRMRHKDGHWVWVNDRGRVVEWTAEGIPFRMLGTHADITDRKQAEADLLEINQTLEKRVEDRAHKIKELHSQLVMQEKMASIGQLAAGIAHELNNPINFVRTNFATLTENFTDLTEVLNDYRHLSDPHARTDARADERADELRALKDRLAAIRQKEATLDIDYLLEDIPAIFSESELGFVRIAHIIQSMRDFFRVDHTGNPTYFNINEGITDALVISKNVYKYHAEVKTNLGELPQVSCMAEQINQVILNLIVNSAQAIAEKSNGDKGLITIRTWSENTHVCCEIADNGPGIPEGIRSRVFEPFFTTKPPGKGTGLGLSISYDIIVHKHKGGLSVSCPESGGTVFTFKIPVNEPTNQAKPLFDMISDK